MTPQKTRAKTAAATTPLGLTSGASKADPASPLYQQVVAVLRAEILDGVYPVGSKLPSEDVLTQRFAVSRHTVREALRQLRADGLVASRQGAGTTIERPSVARGYVHEVASISDLIDYAATVLFKVDTSRQVSGDAQLQQLIGDAAQGKWLCVEGFRHADAAQAPVCWTRIYIHPDFANVGRLIGRGRGAVYEMIEDLHGVRVAEVTQVVKAVPCTPELAAGLQVDAGSTLMEVVRCYRLTNASVAEVAVSYYPAARFSISMTLRRAS